MNFKKIIALILSFMMIIPAAVFAADDDSFDISINGDEMRLLSDLGIISSEFTHDSLITRGELADVLRAMMNYSSSSAVTEQTFDDVLANHKYAASIALVAKAGLMNGDGNGNFRPDDNVSMPEAVTVLVKLLGYGVEADAKGGYPSGYLSVAAELDIANGGASSSAAPIGRDVFYKLVYNTLLTEINERTNYGNDDSYTFKQGDLLISQYFGIYIDEGVLTANNIKNINSDNRLKDGEIAVDGVKYKLDVAIPDRIGFSYRVFYKKDGSDKVVVSCQEMANEVVKLSPDGLDFDPLTISYTYLLTDKLKIYSLAGNVKVLYNNSVLKSNMDTLAVPSNGSVTLINNNDDKKYDVVIIEEYDNIVVDYYSAYKQTLYQRADVYAGGTKEYVFYDYDAVYGYDESGNTIDPTSLTKNTIVSVMENQSKDMLYLKASTATVAGVATQMRQTAGTEIEVLGNWYSFAGDVKFDISTLDIGAAYTFYLDCSNKIAFASKTVDSANCGYVLRVGNISSGLSEGYCLELLLNNSATAVYRLARGINVTYHDGSAVRSERMTPPELIAQMEVNGALYSNNSAKIRQIVMFESVGPMHFDGTDDGGYYTGETNNIITAVTLPLVAVTSDASVQNSQYPLIRQLHYKSELQMASNDEDNKEKLAYYSNIGSIQKTVVFTDDALAFRVPVMSADVGSINQKQLGVSGVSSISNGASFKVKETPNGTYGEFDLYTIGGNKIENDILVRYIVTATASRNSVVSNDGNTYLVAKIRNVVNQEGDPVYGVTLAGQYTTSEYYIDDPEIMTAAYLKEQNHGYDGSDKAGEPASLHPNKQMLQEGDIIRIATSSNVITAIHLMYDYTNDHVTYPKYLDWVNEASRLVVGTVTEKGDSSTVEYAVWKAPGSTDAGITERVRASRAAIYNVKDKTVTYSTLADCDVGDKLASSDRWGALKEFFVYKIRPGR